MMELRMEWILVIVAALSAANCVQVTIDTKNVVNYIDREFVSFSAEPRAVFADSVNPVNELSFQMTRSLGPMYLKVYCDSSQLELQVEGHVGQGAEDPTLVQITPKGWRAFNEWAKQAGVVPIFVLDYDVDGGWKPKSALRMLTVANKLGIRECLWQLGNGNITDAVRYVEDLRAFRAIVKALDFQGIVACDVSSKIAGVEQARFFNFHVEDVADAIAMSYEPVEGRLQQYVVQREPSSLPVWLDIKLPERPPSNGCDQTCLLEGLRYATLLGDAARNGFSAVFKSLSRQEIQSHSFNYLISLLHRSLVRMKVFDTSRTTPEGVQLHANCGSNGNGSLTLLAINHRPEDVDLDIKLASKQFSAEVHHFIATVRNGQILLNEQPHDFRNPLQPLVKIHPLLKGLAVTIPAFSVGFWVIPTFNARECYDDYQELRARLVKREHDSSVHRLLQELIAERSQQDVTQLSRRKRSVGEQLTDVLEENLKSRRTRQTKNYRLKQRVVRQKEKRTERRNLLRQKRPLRERGKRQLRKKNQNRLGLGFLTSRKTKRSFVAEAVDHPPMFANSREEENNRSSFPQGDVHLLISKGPEEESFISIEETPTKQDRSKKSRKRKTSTSTSRSSSQKDLRFVVPEMLMFKESKGPRKRLSAELETSASMTSDRYLPLDTSSKALKIDRGLIEVRNIKVKEGGPVTIQEEGSTTPAPEADFIEEDSFYHEPPTDAPRRSSAAKAEVVPIQDSAEQTDDGVDLFTEHPELNLSLMGSDESEEPAHVKELSRRKRSLDKSGELDRIEAFFLNNTALQQKFAEMFDMLLESFNCCGDSEAENTAKEQLDPSTTEAPAEEQQLQQLERRKRNVLLHHSQSWESRERSNLLHQQRTSGESEENMVPTEPIGPFKRQAESSGDDKGRPGAVMMRSVTNFLKGVSTEFHRAFSHWFPKSAKE